MPPEPSEYTSDLVLNKRLPSDVREYASKWLDEPPPGDVSPIDPASDPDWLDEPPPSDVSPIDPAQVRFKRLNPLQSEDALRDLLDEPPSSDVSPPPMQRPIFDAGPRRPPSLSQPSIPSAGATAIELADVRAAPKPIPGLMVERIPRQMCAHVPIEAEVRVSTTITPGFTQNLVGTGRPVLHNIDVASAMCLRLSAPRGGLLIDAQCPETNG